MLANCRVGEKLDFLLKERRRVFLRLKMSKIPKKAFKRYHVS